ncbi:MAG: hypothetical protein IJI66_08925 [Erysipelotrichaceae bacterium]|nr:hypothetical protein [Erysipelotrichaceae bacterium]
MGFVIKPKKQTVMKNIRIPAKTVERIEKAIEGKGVSFSGFVIQACEFCLQELNSNDDDTEEE